MSDSDWEAEIEAEEYRPKHHKKDAPGWIAGGVFMMMGILLLVSSITGAPFDNWWALFILIPALGSLYVAMRTYTETGAMMEAVRKPLTGGLILLLVSVMFLFNLDWGRYWPFILIIAGGGLGVTALWPK
jgi:hypothetical protein